MSDTRNILDRYPRSVQLRATGRLIFMENERPGGLGVRPFRTVTPNSMEASKSKKAPAAKDAAPAPQDVKRRPIHTFREGDVSASIWTRTVEHHAGAPVTFCSASFERSYRDRDGTWRYTRNFDASDLGALVTVIQRSSEYIQKLQEKPAA